MQVHERPPNPDDNLAIPPQQRMVPRIDYATQLAPEPAIDKMPIQYGSAITLSYVGAAMRLALQGYRMQLVDVLDELLDLEPHGCSVIKKRIEAIAGARLEVTPADVGPNESERAKEVCELVRRQIIQIPYLTQHLNVLLWAFFYGLVGEEILWKREEGEWRVQDLGFIHSRRLAYPDYSSWDLYIWDQGMVRGIGYAPTNGIRGLRIADYPNKFLVYSPKIRGNYATREGVGRMMAVNFCLKRLVKRLTAQDFERFVKPWVLAYWATSDEGKPRAADADDIAYAQAVAKGLGAGSLSSAAMPDSIKMMLERARTGGTFEPEKFVRYLDDEVTKLAVGQTFTTEPGKNGSRAASSSAKQDGKEGDRYLAATLCDMLQQELAGAIVRLNRPRDMKFLPQLTLHLDKPEAKYILEVARDAAASDIPVDGRKVAADIGVPLVESVMVAGPDGKLPEVRMRPLKAAGDEPAAGEEPNDDTTNSDDETPDGASDAPDDTTADDAGQETSE